MRLPLTHVKRNLMIAALLMGCVQAASAQSVNTNYMPGTDFSKYHSYKWVIIDGATPVDQILDQQIKAAVDKQLSSKGFTRKDSDPVDLFVGYEVAMDQEKELTGWGGGGVGWRLGGGMATVTTSTIDVGMLSLDIYDPAQKSLVWRGTASETVSKSGTPEKKQQQLDKAMAKLLKKFPPPAK